MLYRPTLTPELAKQNKAHLERQESLRARAASIATSIEELPQVGPAAPAPEPTPDPQAETAPVMKDPWFSIEAEIDPPEPRMPKVKEIQRAVAKAYSVTRFDLCSQRRDARIVRPRQVAMYLAKTMTLRSLPEIGRRFGGRDHTTVLHAVRKMDALRKSDEKLNEEITMVESLIAGGMS